MKQHEKTGNLRRENARQHDEKYVISMEDKEIVFLCDLMSNKSGFKHVVQARVYSDGHELDRGQVSIQYYNRTWEAWKYQKACLRAAERSGLSLVDKAIVKTILMEETP